jgi:hypothetical protein
MGSREPPKDSNGETFHMKKIIFAAIYFIAISSWANEAQISGLVAPLTLGSFNPFRVGDDVETNRNICIYSNTGYYTVKITDVFNNGNFMALPIGRPTAKTIAYQVFWNTTTGTAGNFQLLSDQVSNVLGGASTVAGCPDGNNANIQIKIPNAQFQGAYAGQYSPSLQIVVIPATAP